MLQGVSYILWDYTRFFCIKACFLSMYLNITSTEHKTKFSLCISVTENLHSTFLTPNKNIEANICTGNKSSAKYVQQLHISLKPQLWSCPPLVQLAKQIIFPWIILYEASTSAAVLFSVVDSLAVGRELKSGRGAGGGMLPSVFVKSKSAGSGSGGGTAVFVITPVMSIYITSSD